jgi:hypothetical protein
MDSYAPTDVCIGALAGFRSPGVAISTKKKAGGFDTCARWLPATTARQPQFPKPLRPLQVRVYRHLQLRGLAF